ncbi:MAG TPA: FAD:protein FMN transferase [Propionicimonas sp.]|nr:FAD:protein FMN transferase [Propionicimonas sp.]
MVASDCWDTAEYSCQVFTAAAADLPLLSELAHERVEALAQACSRQRPDSEVNSLDDPQLMSPLLSAVVRAGLRAAQFSGGLVPGRTQRPVAAVATSAGDQLIETPPRADLDLMPIASAWAADWIAEEYSQTFATGCLVNFDGNIAARGTPPPCGWQIHLEDGQPSSRAHQPIPLWSGGMASATSPAPTASLVSDPNHAPRSWRSVTVAAPSCERAKAAAMAALALGDAAPRWLTQRGLAARLVHTGGITVQTHGWTD